MLKKERQAYILHQVHLHNKVLSSSLCDEVNVSEDTIRRDLQELADEGKLIKVHGGALSHSFNLTSSQSQNVYLQNKKQVIARKAASLITNGMFVLTSGGTTIMELARSLSPQLKATFISGSIPVVLEYMHHPNIEVIVIGDKVSKNSKITIGSEAIAKIKQIKPDICFLGTNALDVEHGVTDNDWEVVQLKKAMIEASKKVAFLMISEKINSVQPIKVCGLNKIDILITELETDDPKLKPYAKAGIKIL
ncbi:MAG TPA: DeoR/GlpR family DNA-binding transcription regulator [Chitinophagaceae bacterium]|nr:DeoR/GlpR transcriptional regulator [Chitinophagaceae bacterium]MCB9056330.1 DeoR/GlpR transcriptional regulator [Chitinophagales bacterium]HPG12900.1 DeoR/GlpR family DNA-binding transcription regulator [Chitinophagaceae bacterium]